MLAKLIAYELKISSRNFIPMYLVYTVLSIVNMLFFENGFLRIIREGQAPDTFSIISIVISCIYFLCMFAIFIITQIFIVTSFYKTTASRKGYFTFSIPVNSFAIINSKFLVAIFWQFITYAVVYISIQVLCSVHGIPNWIQWMFDQMNTAFGNPASFQQYKQFIVLSLIIGIIYSPLQFFSAVAIGQLFSKNRIAWSICFYFVIYTILQTLSSIYLFATDFSGIIIRMSQNLLSMEEYMQYLTSVLHGSLWISVLSGSLMYGITQYIYHKKLNLV